MARTFTAADQALRYTSTYLKELLQYATAISIVMHARAEAAGADGVLAAMNQPPGLNTDPELLLHLKFDETSGTSAADSSANSNDATLSDGTITWVSGEFNNAVQFPASGDPNIQAPNVFDGLESFTTSGTLHKDVAAGNQAIFSCGTGSLTDEIRAYITATGDIAFYYKGNQVTWNIALAIDTTYLWAFTFDNSTNTAELFINGASQGTRTAAGATGQSLSCDDNLYIGNRLGGNSTHTWKGWQDDFRVYSRNVDSAEAIRLTTDPYDTSTLSEEGFLLERIDATSSARFTYIAGDGTSISVSTADNSFPASDEYETGEGFQLGIVAEYDGAGQRIGIGMNGGIMSWTASSTIPTSVSMPSGEFKLGANTVAGASEKPFTGSIQDVAILKDVLTTQEQRELLATSEVNLALDASQTSKVFHAPLRGHSEEFNKSNVSDEVNGFIGTYTSEPKRTWGPAVNRFNALPLMAWHQDPQSYNSARFPLLGRIMGRAFQLLGVAVSLFPGDLAASASQSQFTTARSSFDKFWGKFKSYFALGNHDFDGDGVTDRGVTLVSQPFNIPPQMMSDQEGYQASCDDSGLDAYCQSHVTDIGSDKWHIMTLPFGETLKQRDWAVAQEAKIAAEYPGIKTIIQHHAFSNLQGELYDASDEGGSPTGGDTYAPLRTSSPFLATALEQPVNSGGEWGQPNTGTWDTHFSKMSTLALVISGHDVSSTRKCGILRLWGKAGNSVDCICLNDQRTGANSDGDGLCLLVTVNGNKLKATMYEILTDTFLSSEVNGEFELEIEQEPGVIVDPVVSQQISDAVVPDSRTITLVQTSDGLKGECSESLKVGESKIFAVDFRKDMPVNGRFSSIADVTIESGTADGITFDTGKHGRDRSKIHIKPVAVTAGTYTLRVSGTYRHNGEKAVGDVAFTTVP